MKTCFDCIHFDLCCYIDHDLPVCDSFIDKNAIVKLPCAIGSSYFKPERFCTDGGYYKEKTMVRPSSCESCYSECDCEIRVVEYKFNSALEILHAERYIGSYIFLTREEAERSNIND